MVSLALCKLPNAVLDFLFAGISQEVQGLLKQLRGMKLSAESWDSVCILLSQIDASVMFCANSQASNTWQCLEQRLAGST